MSVGVGVVIPVKPLGRALMRLSSVLDAPSRRALQEAMLADILAACAVVPAIIERIVVTSDCDAAALAERLGARVVPDANPPTGINTAVARGLAELTCPALVLMADLALATPGDLEFVIANALQAPGATLVSSLDGTGTNAMLLSPPGVIEPHLGPGSMALHLAYARRAGVPVRVLERPRLGLDVDTPDDLARFRADHGTGAAGRLIARLDAATPSGR